MYFIGLMKFIATHKAILQLKSDFLKLCSKESITQSIEEIVHAEVYSNVQLFFLLFHRNLMLQHNQLSTLH